MHFEQHSEATSHLRTVRSHTWHTLKSGQEIRDADNLDWTYNAMHNRKYCKTGCALEPTRERMAAIPKQTGRRSVEQEAKMDKDPTDGELLWRKSDGEVLLWPYSLRGVK